jgi:hypothetical protein
MPAGYFRDDLLAVLFYTLKWGGTMKHCRYYPLFNWRVYGAAEKRADQYWKERKQNSAFNSHKESRKRGIQNNGRR